MSGSYMLRTGDSDKRCFSSWNELPHSFFHSQIAFSQSACSNVSRCLAYLEWASSNSWLPPKALKLLDISRLWHIFDWINFPWVYTNTIFVYQKSDVFNFIYKEKTIAFVYRSTYFIQNFQYFFCVLSHQKIEQSHYLLNWINEFQFHRGTSF